MSESSTESSLPTVAIVGRPNVGKSALFNRIVGRRISIVHEESGVTRDRVTSLARWQGRRFQLVDTGGLGLFEGQSGEMWDELIRQQLAVALESADHIIFVGDCMTGITALDEEVARLLRAHNQPVTLAMNKADNDMLASQGDELLALGFERSVAISCVHRINIDKLLDIVTEGFAESDEEEDEEPLKVAIVGRPNVGKSTLFNRLVGEDRSVVHDMSGTTRDAIDTLVETEDGPIVFVDTAGMRRRAKVDDSAEYYSMVRALRAIDEADIALLVIDGTEGVTAQDQRLAERVDAAGCPIVVLLNKWELIDDADDRAAKRVEVGRRLAFLGDSPVLPISALTGKGVHKLRPLLTDAVEQYHRRVPTKDVNRVIAAAQQAQPAGGGAKVLYAVQGATDPPTFTLFVNRELPQHHVRYLERKIREEFGFGSTPIKLRIRKKQG